MTAAYGTVCDGEICMVTGKEPSHIHPITFLVEKKKMVVLHLSGQL